MTEVTLSQRLASLEATSKKLNKASNAMNAVIEGVEKRLVDANPGLSIWFGGDLLDPRLSTVVDDDQNLGTHEWKRETVQWLGFDKLDGEWCLAVKTKRLVHGYYEGDRDSPYTEPFDVGEPFPLRKASREIRLTALGQLPKLIERLEDRAQSAIALISQTEAALT